MFIINFMFLFSLIFICSFCVQLSSTQSCGRTSKPTDENSTITEFHKNAQFAVVGEYPWYAGIYDKTHGNTLICGATILSPYILISAAHCFYERLTRTTRNASNYEIAVSKIFHDRSYIDASTTSFYEIENIVTNGFHGVELRFQKDIAILVTKTKMVFNSAVTAICLFQEDFPVVSSSILKLPVWKSNQTNSGVTSKVLMQGFVQFFDYEDCFKNLPSIQLDYLTLDKFCITHDGTLGMRNAGNGLTYQTSNDSPHYLVGFVSARIIGGESEDLNYALSTDMNFYLPWINKTMSEIHKKKQFEF